VGKPARKLQDGEFRVQRCRKNFQKRKRQKEYREKENRQRRRPLRGVSVPTSWYRQPAITGGDIKTTGPNGTIFDPRIDDEHELPRQAISSTLAKNLFPLTNKPHYLANMVASAIRPDSSMRGPGDHGRFRRAPCSTAILGAWQKNGKAQQRFIRAALATKDLQSAKKISQVNLAGSPVSSLGSRFFRFAWLSLMACGGLQKSRNSSAPRPDLIVDGTDVFGTRTCRRA